MSAERRNVVVLGAIVAFDVKAPVAVAMGLVGFFAIFHGHAHGAEIPENAGASPMPLAS